jgi:cytochrome d ubiquinol oxidase subunit II
MDLNTIWFVLIFVLLAGYAVLDGFDLGVGVLHLLARGEEERRVSINAIAPVWDGNEVWLLAGGGALFAAFPQVYATVFSGFYLALMLLLVFLIFRAVSMEFRGKVESDRWRRVWDWAFALGSVVPALLLGVAMGNVLRGIPIDAEHRFTGTFFSLLNPYALIVGVLGLSLFTYHGALYLALKCNGGQRYRVQRWLGPLWTSTMLLWIFTTVATPLLAPHLIETAAGRPAMYVCIALSMIGLIMAGALGMGRRVRVGWALMFSGLTIVAMMGLAAVGLYPNLAPSLLGDAFSLNIYNAASTPRTLTAMLVIALVGMPIVLLYTAFIYRAFRGKVVLGTDSY